MRVVDAAPGGQILRRMLGFDRFGPKITSDRGFTPFNRPRASYRSCWTHHKVTARHFLALLGRLKLCTSGLMSGDGTRGKCHSARPATLLIDLEADFHSRSKRKANRG